MRLLRVCMTAIAITGLVAGSAAAQDDGPNNGAVSLGAGIDFSTSYFFRGIIQETEGFIAQPFLEGGISLYESDEAGLQSVSVTAGTWVVSQFQNLTG